MKGGTGEKELKIGKEQSREGEPPAAKGSESPVMGKQRNLSPNVP